MKNLDLTYRPRLDRSGTSIGNQTLLSVAGGYRFISEGKNKVKVVYNVKCECGAVRACLWNDLQRGKTKQCRSCSGSYSTKHLIPAGSGASNHNYKGTKDIPGGYFSQTISNARARDLDFHLTIDDMQDLFDQQKGLCSYSGRSIQIFCRKKYRRNNLSTAGLYMASLDRKDSTKGYTWENCHWVCSKVNQIKMNLSEEDFLKTIKEIYLHQKEKHEAQ